MSWVLIRKTIRDYRLMWGAIFLLLSGFVVLYMFATNAVPMEKIEIARLPVNRVAFPAKVAEARA